MRRKQLPACRNSGDDLIIDGIGVHRVVAETGNGEPVSGSLWFSRLEERTSRTGFTLLGQARGTKNPHHTNTSGRLRSSALGIFYRPPIVSPGRTPSSGSIDEASGSVSVASLTQLLEKSIDKHLLDVEIEHRSFVYCSSLTMKASETGGIRLLARGWP